MRGIGGMGRKYNSLFLIFVKHKIIKNITRYVGPSPCPSKRGGINSPYYFNYANRTVLGLGVDIAGEILGLSPGDNEDEGNWGHG